MQTWTEAQKWELEWHKNQQFNTLNEEVKQMNCYAPLLGLNQFQSNYYGIRTWNMPGKSIVDIGGGEVSMLLKTKAKRRVVLDPLDYPKWVRMRYEEAGIEFVNIPAEKIEVGRGSFSSTFDEAWIYNCLQHVIDPSKIIRKVKACTKVIRIFEWIDTGISDGHLHNLTEEKLNSWLGGIGKVTDLNQGGCVGKCFSGIFKGNKYDEV